MTRRHTLSADIRKRPNRAHGAVDALPQETQRQIVDWYRGKPEDDIPRLTLDEISAELKRLGYDITRGQVWRWISRQRNTLDQLRDMAASVDVLATEAGLEDLLLMVVLKALKGSEVTQAATIQDLISLADAVGRFRDSAAARDRWEQEKNRRITEAVETLKDQVGKSLENLGKSPDLCGRLFNFVDQAAEAMMERAG